MKTIKVLAFAALFAAISPTQAGEVFHDTFAALGTTINTQIKADSLERANFCKKTAQEEIDRLEKLLSAYIPDSDLNRLAAAKGEWVKVDPSTAEVLEKTKEVCQLTNGALDPTVGTLVKLWSVDQPNHRVPTDEEIAAVLPYVDWHKIETKKEGNDYYARIGKNQEITVGATGKGFIADKVAEKLLSVGCNDFIVSLGGNIITAGTNGAGRPWMIGLQEPDLTRGENFAALPSHDESFVTSGDYEKFFVKDGVKYHHILDPRTGKPVPATLSSVSIINKNSTYADGLCTALFVMGWQGAINFLRDHPELKGVLLNDKFDTVVFTPNIEDEIFIIKDNLRQGVIEPKKMEQRDEVNKNYLPPIQKEIPKPLKQKPESHQETFKNLLNPML